MGVYHVHNFRLRQKNQVIFPELHGPDGLEEAKATAIPDIVHSKI